MNHGMPYRQFRTVHQGFPVKRSPDPEFRPGLRAISTIHRIAAGFSATYAGVTFDSDAICLAADEARLPRRFNASRKSLSLDLGNSGVTAGIFAGVARGNPRSEERRVG